MRAEGLLPNISHLTYSLSDSGRGTEKYYKENASTPLTMWNGLKSVYIYGKDTKAQVAIIHGISQLSPPPLVEFGVGDMRTTEFKSLFRLRKGKLQPGTELRLITRRPKFKRRSGAYYCWDEHAESYWTEMKEDAAQIADKHGVKLEVTATPLDEWNAI
jgi:hypothetical protein